MWPIIQITGKVCKCSKIGHILTGGPSFNLRLHPCHMMHLNVLKLNSRIGISIKNKLMMQMSLKWCQVCKKMIGKKENSRGSKIKAQKKKLWEMVNKNLSLKEWVWQVWPIIWIAMLIKMLFRMFKERSKSKDNSVSHTIWENKMLIKFWDNQRAVVQFARIRRTCKTRETHHHGKREN